MMGILFSAHLSRAEGMKGTEFWFGFMENQQSFAGIEAYVAINSEVNTNGVVEIPGAGWSQTFTVAANSSVQIQLPSNLVHNLGNMTISNKGVYVETQDSVYLSIVSTAQGSTDASAITPVYALGYDYFATSYIDDPNTNWGTPEVLIVATEDNTTVRVSPSGALSNGTTAPFTVNLNKGQCYQIQSYWGTGASHNGNDLSGTLVESICNSTGIKHPISVFSGDMCSIVGGAGCSGCDHLMEQLHDYHTWGKDFVIIPPRDRNDYKLKIVAAYNGTVVSGGGFAPQTLNSGDYVELNLSGQNFISASLPVSVAQITYGQGCSSGYGDPMMSFIPPVTHFKTDWSYQSFDDPSGLYLNYLTIITNTANTGNVMLDGAPVPAGGFSPNAINPSYSWITLPMPIGTIAHRVTSSGGFIALPHGYTGAASYYLNSGINVEHLEPDFDMSYLIDTTNYLDFDDTVCACEPVHFIAEYYDTSAVLDWDFGDGTSAQGFNVSHTYSNGHYDVVLTLKDAQGCAYDTLLKQNLVVINCDITLSSLDTLCIGESVTLTSNAGSSFMWSTGETTSSITVSPTTTTTYGLQIDGGSVAICDSVTVYVHPPFNIGFNDTIHFCETDTVTLNGPSGMNSYLWSTGSNQPNIEANTAGLYWLTVENTNGCFTTDSVELLAQLTPSWSLGPDLEACEGQIIQLSGPVIPGAQYTWSTQEVTQNINVDETGDYTLMVEDGVCTSEDVINVQFNKQPEASFPATFYLCDKQLELTPSPETLVSYEWSTGENTPSIVVTESGTYWVDMDNNCGSVRDEIEVIFDCTYSLYIPNAFSPNDDGINDYFKAEGTGIVEFEMRIFDRWGEQVFLSNNINQSWDGMYKGQAPKLDVYTWVVRTKDVRGRFHDLNGHVTIVR